jgi:hypothetical protein
MTPTDEVISKYYETFRKGIDTGIMHLDQFPFDDEVRIYTPTGKMAGKEEVFSLYLESIGFIEFFELKEVFFSPDSACGILEITTFDETEPVLAVDWFHLEEGKIVQIHWIYDSAAWKKERPK